MWRIRSYSEGGLRGGRWRFLVQDNRVPQLLALTIVVVAYVAHYVAFPGTPGNSPSHPLGWFGWHDQGWYWKQSHAFVAGDFAAGRHLYPPLYPLLGAVLLPLSKLHSYFPVNLVLVIAYGGFFLAAMRHYINPWLAAFALLLGMNQNLMMGKQWAIPWTSTASAVWMMAALYLLDRYVRLFNDRAWGTAGRLVNAAAFGIAIGLLLPTRPGDFAASGPMALLYAALLTHQLIRKSGRERWRNLACALVGSLGAGVPIAAYLFFNLVVFGGPFEGYFNVASRSGGFWFSDIGEKLYSLLMHSETFYGELSADWLAQMPLFLVALFFLLPALIFTPLIFRVLALSILIQIFIVFSFADALPTGTFRYYNIHYFKWAAAPALAIAFCMVQNSILGSSVARRRASIGVGVAAAIAALSFSITATPLQHPMEAALISDRELDLATLETVPLDYVDFHGVTGAWTDIYFSANSAVRVNGNRDLRHIRDYRFLPIMGGARLLLIRPSDISRLEIRLGKATSFGTNTKPIAVQIEFGFVGFRSAATN